MNKSALIQGDIDTYNQELLIYQDCLDYALKTFSYADIERYTDAIEFTHRKIGEAELKLYMLTETS